MVPLFGPLRAFTGAGCVSVVFAVIGVVVDKVGGDMVVVDDGGWWMMGMV